MGSWSDIPAELLVEITGKLDLIDVVRTGAVCTWWSKVTVDEKHPPRSQIPWLMFSPKPNSDQCLFIRPNSLRYMYSMTEKKLYEFDLPGIAGQRCIGSSNGYLLLVDSNANLVATNPLKPGSRLPLPPTSSLFHSVRRDSSGRITTYKTNDGHVHETSYIIKNFYGKAILSPDRKTAVAYIRYYDKHCYARIGDKCWKILYSVGQLEDFIFHQGRLCAVPSSGTLFIHDLSDGSKQIDESAEGAISMDSDFGEYEEPITYLVESPCRFNLYLVFRFSKHNRQHQETGLFKVFVLDKAATTWKWKQINSLGEYSFFVGFNYSMALCATELPGLKKNCIYFTNDVTDYPSWNRNNGVFSFDDGSVKPLYEDDNLDPRKWAQPVWFVPTML